MSEAANMGSINSMPVVSQIKSLVQVIAGDAEGAKKTQEEFSRKGIVISQVRSWTKGALVEVGENFIETRFYRTSTLCL